MGPFTFEVKIYEEYGTGVFAYGFLTFFTADITGHQLFFRQHMTGHQHFFKEKIFQNLLAKPAALLTSIHKAAKSG